MTSPGVLEWPSEPPRHGGVLLRPSADTDVSMVRALARDPYVPLIGSIPAGATEAQARDWIAAQHVKYAEGRGFPFTIADSATDAPLGHCGLWLGGIAAGRASVGYAIAPEHRGRGVAADALVALTAFAWTVRGIHRLEAYIEPSNTASARTTERAGYAPEGVLRSHQVIGGMRRDMALFAAVRPTDA